MPDEQAEECDVCGVNGELKECGYCKKDFCPTHINDEENLGIICNECWDWIEYRRTFRIL